MITDEQHIELHSSLECVNLQAALIKELIIAINNPDYKYNTKEEILDKISATADEIIETIAPYRELIL